MAGGVHNELKILVIGLILGTFSLLIASAFRDALDAFLQMSVPVSERALGNGIYLLLWRICFFLIILALLAIASICLM
jgi:hypothetical protein